MKSYREIADSVFARREQYVIAQRKKKQLVTRVTASVGSVALVSLAGIALLRSDAFRETPPLSDGGATTTTVAPTEKDSTTTTTASTTASTAPTTTDGGIVTPPTTAPTTAPSKTEPPKTTTSTTAPKDKLLITGVETIDDDTLDQMPTGLFKAGEISPLLKQTMDQHKNIDAVYAVLIAINPKYNQKLVDDCNEAVDALLQSDGMVKLAEQRDLAYGVWQAAEEEWKANIGNEEVITTEFIEKLDRAKETYRSLRSEYEKRERDFKLAYWNACADEAVEVLAKLSDIEPIPLEGRWKEDLEKNEKAVLSYVLSAAYGTKKSDGSLSCYGYAAVLSADEILELSECGSYMFWLDSYDEEAYMDYLNDCV